MIFPETGTVAGEITVRKAPLMTGTQSLETAPAGVPLRVAAIHGGREVRARLSALGILPGTTLRVVNRGPLGGPVLVDVGGTRVAIGRGLARKVAVSGTGPA